ncbi:hypothetical protein LEP48_15225 [Isoptericola sp. NEAU-Y5]|uniref:PH domain-containing protein n=1 Tax=Isoptericola luteus TaxID=2879484 RepID=A0ABS7ZI31_9MICO|nr:hypothetical protein [Isoptericola sp. NEAU-Y5]MCA5894690.1 hypothetical protein [Isoptericola sp. NEAU-Y5]
MTMPVAVGIWVALGVVLLLLVLTGRRRLAARTRQTVPPPPAVPAGLGALRLGPVAATYVSSTLSGDWLARVGAHSLGDRAAGQVSVHDAGVLVERDGAPDVFVPTAALRDVGLAPGMAGKFVGTDGLVVVTWEDPAADDVPAVVLDTGLRTRLATDRARLVDAVRHLMTSAPAPKDPQ